MSKIKCFLSDAFANLLVDPLSLHRILRVALEECDSTCEDLPSLLALGKKFVDCIGECLDGGEQTQEAFWFGVCELLRRLTLAIPGHWDQSRGKSLNLLWTVVHYLQLEMEQLSYEPQSLKWHFHFAGHLCEMYLLAKTAAADILVSLIVKLACRECDPDLFAYFVSKTKLRIMKCEEGESLIVKAERTFELMTGEALNEGKLSEYCQDILLRVERVSKKTALSFWRELDRQDLLVIPEGTLLSKKEKLIDRSVAGTFFCERCLEKADKSESPWVTFCWSSNDRQGEGTRACSCGLQGAPGRASLRGGSETKLFCPVRQPLLSAVTCETSQKYMTATNVLGSKEASIPSSLVAVKLALSDRLLDVFMLDTRADRQQVTSEISKRLCLREARLRLIWKPPGRYPKKSVFWQKVHKVSLGASEILKSIYNFYISFTRTRADSPKP